MVALMKRAKHRPPGVRKSGPAQRKIGRPAGTFKRIDTAKLIADVARGVPLAIACGAVGITPRTFEKWLDERPEFAQSLAVEKQKVILEWLAIVLSASKEKEWRGASWALERVYPDSFAPKPQLALGVQNNTFMISIEKAREIENMRANLLPQVNARLAALSNGENINGTTASS
jgi:hypothetical protein